MGWPPPGIWFLFPLVAFVPLYSFWLGTVLARLWYYKGRVHGDFVKYDIQPAYKRERNAARRNSEAATLADNDKDRGHWRAVAQPMRDEEDVDDPALKRQIMEDKRISRLSTYLQDEGFHVGYVPDHEYGVPVAEYNRQFNERKPVDYRDLGLARTYKRDWLTVDNDFREHTEAKQKLMDKKLEQCVVRTPAVKGPSEELLVEMVDFLLGNHPSKFSKLTRFGFPHIKNQCTDDLYRLASPYEPQALETLGRLAVEDFVFFGRNGFSGVWQVIGGTVCFPSGWKLSSIIGQEVENLLSPVISWDKLFDILECIDHANDTSLLRRTETFIQTNPSGERTPLEKLLCIEAPQDFFPGHVSTLVPADMVVREERQTFRKLPQSGAIVMTVKTILRDLTQLYPTERKDLAAEINSWPNGDRGVTARLKGKSLWGSIVLDFLEGRKPVYID